MLSAAPGAKQLAAPLLLPQPLPCPPAAACSISLHAKFGAYYRTRVPKAGRDLAYCPFSAELLVAASAPEVYRLNLSEGRFLAPLASRSPAVNACGISPSHGLLACAGEDGALECFDLRQRDALGRLDASAAAGARGQPLTALRFDDSGMHLAVGTGNGLVAIFDLRSQVGAGGGGCCWLAG